MTTQEFSLEFDILYNNIMSNAAPGLNLYEKSVFLTQAQERLVHSLYRGEGELHGIETTEETAQVLKEIITTSTLPIIKDEVLLPSNLLYILREEVDIPKDRITCNTITFSEVIPATTDTISRLLKNPFKGIKAGIFLRLLEGNKAKLYGNYEAKNYRVTYLRRPNPIILEDLPTESIENEDGSISDIRLSINGISNKTECELNHILHRRILDIAVQLAKISWRS